VPFEVGTGGADIDAFMTSLDSFLTTNSWTQVELDTINSTAGYNNGTVHVQMEWSTLTDINFFQSQASSAAVEPGSNTNDSGNGNANDLERRMDGVGNGPFVSHFFVTDSATVPTYCHGVLEYEVGKFRHFSFGEVEKKGTWTGGDYVVAHVWDTALANIDDPADLAHSVLWDAVQTAAPSGNTANQISGTIHMEGFTNQPASGKYGIFWGGTVPGNDGDSNGRTNVLGGVRGGPYLSAMGWIPASPVNGFIPLLPVPLYYRNTTTTPDQLTELGWAPGVRMVNIKNLTVATDYTVGANTWRVYPLVRKQFLEDNTEESWSAGIAYLKVS